MKTVHARTLTFVVAAACGGEDGKDQPPVDGPGVDTPVSIDARSPDGPAGTAATVVDCAGATQSGDVWYYSGVGFMVPTAPIAVGQVIRFHDLETHTADHLEGLWTAGGNQEVCVRFDGAGSYGFRCYFHSSEQFAIVVQ